MSFKTYFQVSWLNNPEFSSWLRRCPGDNSKAYCAYCRKDFSLSTMGTGALKSHNQSKKHRDASKFNSRTSAAAQSQLQLTDMFEPAAKRKKTQSETIDLDLETPSELTPPTPATTCFTLDKSIQESATKAEILWTLKTVTAHFSMKSCEDIVPLFQVMFPDSAVAKQMSCGERKCSYLASFGIGPYLQDQINQRVRGEMNYVILFDESLNAELQKKQLDVHVRFWDGNEVATRYSTSVFLGHATAVILAKEVEEVCRGLGLANIAQLSMDGPNVNWKMFELLQQAVNEERDAKLLDVGSCGLHIVHNAFLAGHSEAGWSINKFLSALYWLFDNSPARREDFFQATGSDKFPLQFCKHRWVENVNVAERALEVWPHFLVYMKAAKKAKIEPKNQSYESLNTMASDKFLLAKVQAFISIAKDVEPFLRRFQTDAPVLSYLCTELCETILTLLRRVMTESALKNVTGARSLMELNLDKDHVPDHKIDVGFATRCVLKELRQEGVPESQLTIFKIQMKSFIMTIVKRLKDKSPLKHALARNMECLTPQYMLGGSKLKLSNLLINLQEKGWINKQEGEDIEKQYVKFTNFIKSEKALHAAFQSFDPHTGRLDSFLHQHMAKNAEFSTLWKAVKYLLLLSHGQATVERGFSINKEVSTVNMKEHTIIAQRVIIDHVKRHGGVLNVPLTKGMMLAAKTARQKYFFYLEKQKEEAAKEKEKKKKKDAADEIDQMKTNLKKLEEVRASLLKEAKKLDEKAFAASSLQLYSKAHSLRNQAEAADKEIGLLREQLEAKALQLTQ